jgi:REP element-mobilizing transposase RayT
MTYDPQRHHRRSIRFKGYDYSRPGAYYVTICAQKKDCIFGRVVDGHMYLNDIGAIVYSEWAKTEDIRDDVVTDAFVVMPNHFHGILILFESRDRGTGPRAPTFENFGKPTRHSIPTIIRSFKATVTKQINEIRETPGKPVWQRNYYEHIVRNENELNRIRRYIIENPMKWDSDRRNPVKF